MNQYFKLLKKHSATEEHYNIVLNHSLLVLSKSVNIIARKKLYNKVDFDLIISGCLLHDIGAFEFMKNFDKFQKDYLKHGIIGGKILRKEGLKKEALIAERHIGSGLSKNYIIENNLPLPKKDFLPVTLEQKLICYADKFHSKSNKKDTLKSNKKEMRKFEEEPLRRFLELEKMFG
ncbi:MAG: HDIG domain-containing protein [Candidatus Andersenbacteria bacterium]|nr:HDIG domain-containing protein [Candidatus Andersenbacteria bacterium]